MSDTFSTDAERKIAVAPLLERSVRAPYGEQENVMTRTDHAQGTDNVLLDLGFNDAEELSAKAALALKLNALIDQRGLCQIAAATIIGMTQPKVSQYAATNFRTFRWSG